MYFVFSRIVDCYFFPHSLHTLPNICRKTKPSLCSMYRPSISFRSDSPATLIILNYFNSGELASASSHRFGFVTPQFFGGNWLRLSKQNQIWLQNYCALLKYCLSKLREAAEKRSMEVFSWQALPFEAQSSCILQVMFAQIPPNPIPTLNVVNFISLKYN